MSADPLVHMRSFAMAYGLEIASEQWTDSPSYEGWRRLEVTFKGGDAYTIDAGPHRPAADSLYRAIQWELQRQGKAA